MSIRAFLVLLTFSAITTSVSADDDYSAKVVATYVNDGGQVLIKIDSNESWLEIGQAGDPTVDAMYSTALASKLGERPDVWVRYIPRSTGYPEVKVVSIGH